MSHFYFLFRILSTYNYKVLNDQRSQWMKIGVTSEKINDIKFIYHHERSGTAY